MGKTLGTVLATIEILFESKPVKTYGLRLRNDRGILGISFFQSENSIYTEDDSPSTFATSEVIEKIQKVLKQRKFRQGKIETEYTIAVFNSESDFINSVRETLGKVYRIVKDRYYI